ncbi:hypothetical protein EVAR_30692_1 [Eumeta japonica]|uniref:Uncharacterized protein n=1 Tax=Eumeta variegata TaxID=151549 RepID=A0A4C1V5R8_EUMVA|nr:hypothetical protein EVAR_30692_1 [Eumeta japonica]
MRYIACSRCARLTPKHVVRGPHTGVSETLRVLTGKRAADGRAAKEVIRQQNISRFIGKQITGPVLPLRTLAPPGAGQVMRPGGAMGLGTTMGSNQTMALCGSRGATAGMGPSGSMGRGVAMGGVGVGALAGMAAQAQDIVTFIQSLQNRLSIMTARDMGGQVGPACSATGQQVGQLDRFEAARRQNQENVPYLRELLEQHLLQQQLHGAGAHAARGDLMRPIMPSNPGLRRLLQQEQHQSPTAVARRGRALRRGDLMRPIMPSNQGSGVYCNRRDRMRATVDMRRAPITVVAWFSTLSLAVGHVTIQL